MLVDDPRVVDAARIGAAFRMDPVAHLGSSWEERAIRVAGFQVLVRDAKRHAPRG